VSYLPEQAAQTNKNTASKWPRTFRALQHRNYRLYWFGQIFSLIGTWMQIVAQGWLIYRLTDSPFMLGMVNLVGLLPVVPISLLSGVISDRFSRRKIILITEVILMLQALILAALTWLDIITVWHVIVLSFVLGAAAALEQPVRLAIVVDLVGKEDLTNAVALNSSIYNSARIIGPAIAGFLVAFWGEAGCFLINGLSFSGVIIALLLMDFPAQTTQKEPLQIGAKLIDGFRYIWEEKTIRMLLVIIAYSSFLTLPYVALMPAFAKDILRTGPEGLGLLMTGIGIGAMVGALGIAGIQPGKRGLWMTVGNVLGPLLLLLFTLTRSLALSLMLITLIGGSNAIRQSMANSLIQLTTLDEFHGRVMSIFNLIFNGMSRVGALVIGGIAEFSGVSWALAMGGAISLLISLLIIWRMSYVHQIP